MDTLDKNELMTILKVFDILEQKKQYVTPNIFNINNIILIVLFVIILMLFLLMYLQYNNQLVQNSKVNSKEENI